MPFLLLKGPGGLDKLNIQANIIIMVYTIISMVCMEQWCGHTNERRNSIEFCGIRDRDWHRGYYNSWWLPNLIVQLRVDGIMYHNLLHCCTVICNEEKNNNKAQSNNMQ